MANKNIKGITVEIGGDATKLDKALKDVEDESKKASSELLEINRAMKNNGESAELWKQKQDVLTKSLDESKKKLEILKNVQEQVEQQFNNGEIGADQYRAFQREVIAAENNVDDFQTQLSDLSRTAFSTADQVEDLGEAAEDAGDKAENSGGGFTVMKGALADLAAEGIRKAVDGFKELATEGDTALNTLQTKTGATAGQMEEYRDIINDLYSDNMGENRIDIADSIAEVKQQMGDIDASSLEDVTNTALLMRDTFEFDVNESVRAANMLMQQFGVTADEAYTLIAQGAQGSLNKNGDLLDTINEYSVHYSQLGYTAEEFFNSLSNGASHGTFSVDKLGDAMKEFGIRQKEGADETISVWQRLGVAEVDYGEDIKKATELIEEKTTKIEKLKNQIKYARMEQDEFNSSTSEIKKQKTSDSIAEMEKELENLESELANNKNTLEALSNHTSTAKYTVDELMEAFNSGGEGAKEATNDLVQALFALEDETLKNQFGVQLFGTMWEDLQASGIEALTNVTGEADKAKNTLQDIADVKYNDLGSQFQQVGRQVKTELLEPIAEKALPIIKEGTDWLVKNLPKIAPLVKGIATEFAIFKSSQFLAKGIDKVGKLTDKLKAGESAASLLGSSLTSKLTLATTAATLFGMVMQEVATAGGAASEESLKQLNNYKEKCAEASKELDGIKDSAFETANAELVQSDRTKALWQELQQLADSSGKVKKKDEERAKFIVGELKEATGIDIEMIDGKIQKYSELCDQVDKAIEKRRAEAMLEAYDSKTAEVRENAEDAKKDYLEKQSYYEALSNPQTEEERQIRDRKFLENYGTEYKNASTAQLDDFNKTISYAKAEADSAKEVYDQNDTFLDDVEKAYDAYEDGQYDRVDSILHYQETANEKAVKDTTKTTEEQEEAFEKMIDDVCHELDLANQSSSQSLKQSTAESMLHLVNAYTEGGLTSGVKFSTEMKQQIQAAIDAGVNFDAFIEAAGDAGWNLGELLGQSAVGRYQEIIAARLGVQTRQLYANNDLIRKSINSQSDAHLYDNGKGSYQIEHHATGGFIRNGETSFVAEAGPELIQIMNGGVKVTPMTATARNHAVEGNSTQRVFYNNITVNVDKISSDYDVSTLGQRLAAELNRAERGKS